MSNQLNLQDFSVLQKPQFGLSVGIPTLGSHRMEFTLGLMQCGFPINTIGQYIPIVGHKVGEARNMIAHVAKFTKARYLAFVDEDVLLPANAFRKLVWDLENNPHISVAAGVYATKSDPPMPLIFDQPGVGPSYNWHQGDFRQVYAIGMGCAIIRVADLPRLDGICGRTKIDNFPTIGFNSEVVEYYKDGTAWIKDEDVLGKGWSMTFTEDMYFCMKCNDAGLLVYADTSIICGHIDGNGRVYSLGECRPTVPLAQVGDPIYFDLGAGDIMRYWVDNRPMLRVDLDPANRPDMVQDVRDLDIRDNVADGVSLIHVLEHMNRHDAETVLDEMVRIMKPGAAGVIATPDMKLIADWYSKQGDLNDLVLRAVFGGQHNEFQFHKSGWDVPLLKKSLEGRGCVVTDVAQDADLLGLTVWFHKLPWTPPEETKADAPADAVVDAEVTVLPTASEQHDFAEPLEPAISTAHAETGDIKE